MKLTVYRGETFRGALLHLGEIRSILPEGVPIMALTATATKTLQMKVSRILGMHGPTVISISPCKKNILYAVAGDFQPLLIQLIKERENAESHYILSQV